MVERVPSDLGLHEGAAVVKCINGVVPGRHMKMYIGLEEEDLNTCTAEDMEGHLRAYFDKKAKDNAAVPMEDINFVIKERDGKKIISNPKGFTLMQPTKCSSRGADAESVMLKKISGAPPREALWEIPGDDPDAGSIVSARAGANGMSVRLSMQDVVKADSDCTEQSHVICARLTPSCSHVEDQALPRGRNHILIRHPSTSFKPRVTRPPSQRAWQVQHQV